LQQSVWNRRLVRVGDIVVRRHAIISLACCLVMLVLAAGIFKINTTVQLMKLFDSGANIIQDYTWLEKNLGNLVPMEVVLRVDESRMREGTDELLAKDGRYRLTFLERMELVKRVQERIEGLPAVGRALSMVTFAPELPRQSNNLASFTERSGYNAALKDHRAEFLAEDYFREGENEELFRISARLPALGDVDYGEYVEEIRGAVQPVLAAYRERDRILAKMITSDDSVRDKQVCLIGVSNPENAELDNAADPVTKSRLVMVDTLAELLRVAGVKVKTVKQPLHGFEPQSYIVAGDEHPKASAFFNRFDLVYVAHDHPSVATKYIERHAQQFVDVREISPLDVTRETEQANGIWPIYTGVVPLVYKAQRTLLHGLINSIGLAFILICLVMIVILRSPTAGLLSMIPNVFPIVVIFGFMGWVGILVDIGAMMTASVAMGVAVDDTVHFLTWFRRGILKGLDRRGAVRLAYQRCATAMIQTTVIGGLGLGVFALSTFTPTQRFGYLMMVLLATALVGDLVFLPALLAGPIGKFFTGRLRREAVQAAMQSEENVSSEGGHAIPAPHYLNPALDRQPAGLDEDDRPNSLSGT
ncbi:MAG: MMPL family transporter, partial [Planctomycetales bacterium]